MAHAGTDQDRALSTSLHRTPIRLLERLLVSHSACALAASQAGLVAKEGGSILNGSPGLHESGFC
ncbi:unnamed protein product [Ectocarpus sp. 8 AP-2014]